MGAVVQPTPFATNTDHSDFGKQEIPGLKVQGAEACKEQVWQEEQHSPHCSSLSGIGRRQMTAQQGISTVLL